jgi:uncharacterized membrane protein YcaP (DUF421 family)
LIVALACSAPRADKKSRTWLSVRYTGIQSIVKANPTLLLYQGEFREQVMKQERVPESEVRAALRAPGIASIEGVGAVVLETDGRFSIIQDLGEKPATSLQDVASHKQVSGR